MARISGNQKVQNKIPLLLQLFQGKKIAVKLFGYSVSLSLLKPMASVHFLHALYDGLR